MATRSRIAIETTDAFGNKVIKSIYCHWDGYPSYNGKILYEHYTSRDKVSDLIELGDISSLGYEINPTQNHSFDQPQEGVTVAYRRDRKEKIRPPRQDFGISDFVKSDIEEYGYLFTEEGEWLFIDGHRNPYTREAIPLWEVL